MKKDHLPIWPSNTNKGEAKSIEVFFLKDPLPRVVDDAGCDMDSGKYVAGPPFEYHCNLGELDVNENSAGGGAHFYHQNMSEEDVIRSILKLSLEEKLANASFGHEGKTGPRGYEEINIYKLILDSLNKALPDAKESFREVVADGIAKRITKYMNGEE